MFTFTGNQLYAAACTACNLSTLGGLHFNIVHQCSHRDVAQRHRVACLDRGITSTANLGSCRNALRRQDITALAIGVQQQRNVCRAVRVILNTFNLCRYTRLVTLEINRAITLLVTAATMARRNTTRIVPATGF